MTSRQPDLFGHIPGSGAYGEPLAAQSPLAAAADPVTSHLAAERVLRSGRVDGQGAIIIAILRRLKVPSTYREVFAAGTDAERAELVEANTVGKRLSGLERRGLVRRVEYRRCTIGGSRCQEWTAA